MKLPGGDNAIVEMEKLTEYCLSRHHPRGRHKAKVFHSVLGLTDADAEELRISLQRAATEEPAVPGVEDEYGTRYIVDFEVVRRARQATIRSVSMLSSEESVPRFITCFIL